jgi:GMP synthase-like glutamine amidotransferase
MKIHCLRHTELAVSDYLPKWAAHHGHSWECTLVPSAERLPQLSDLDCLIVLGGPMSVWDEEAHPWLRGEKRYLEKVMESGKPLLGICLGAQLLAEVLGARTYTGSHQEIGWFPVETTPESRDTWLGDVFPPRFVTYLWHGDTYDLPNGAVHIARSAAFENQGFIWNYTMALQFHLEVRPAWVRSIATRDANVLVPAPYIQSVEKILGQPESLYRANNTLMDTLLQRWFNSVPHRN